MAVAVYNASYYTVIKCSHTRALKGYDPVLLGDLLLSSANNVSEVPAVIQRVSELIRTRELIKNHLAMVQEYYYKYYNHQRKDLSFQVGN